jgi:hypothetical protein
LKVIVDYLPQDILEKYLEKISKARVYAEPVYDKTERYMEYVAQQLGKKY